MEDNRKSSKQATSTLKVTLYFAVVVALLVGAVAYIVNENKVTSDISSQQQVGTEAEADDVSADFTPQSPEGEAVENDTTGTDYTGTSIGEAEGVGESNGAELENPTRIDITSEPIQEPQSSSTDI